MASGKSTSKDFPDVLFHHKDITLREVGAVYIVYNDYHTKENLVLHGLEADSMNIEWYSMSRFMINQLQLASHLLLQRYSCKEDMTESQMKWSFP